MATYNDNLAAAVALALTQHGVEAFLAAADDAKTKALNTATLRIDAQKFHGRRYNRNQAKPFPRVSASVEGRIDDWDAVNGVAIVPEAVKLAEIHEAQRLIVGEAARVQDAIASGLASQTTGSLSESYRPDAALSSRLCPEAERLLSPYRLRSGGVR